MLKIANVGLTVTGIAVGAAVGGPAGAALGGQIGGAVGNLAEQGGNELFHYERTDRLARSIAREQAHRRSREPQNFFPTATQLRNAADVSREISAGVLEGLASAERSRDSGAASQQAGFPEEINATVVLEWPDGATIELRDQMIRLQNQDRSL